MVDLLSEALGIGGGDDKEQPGLFAQELRRGNAEETALMIPDLRDYGSPEARDAVAQKPDGYRGKLGPGNLDQARENWISMSPPAWIVDQMWGLGVALLGQNDDEFSRNAGDRPGGFPGNRPLPDHYGFPFLEELASRIRVRMADAGWVKRLLFREAERIGRAVLARQIEKKTLSPS